jgi:hypothetical protein
MDSLLVKMRGSISKVMVEKRKRKKKLSLNQMIVKLHQNLIMRIERERKWSDYF